MTAPMKELDANLKRLFVYLREQVDGPLDPATVGPDTTLADGLGISSLQAVSLAMDIEEEFGISIDDNELEALRTVGDVLRLIAEKTGQPAV